MDIKVVLPERKMDRLAVELLELTEAIAGADAERVAHGFLGGEFGYGGHWDSAVFMMHPYCWCEQEDCPWCCGCDCGPSTYLVEGREASFDEWLAAYDRGLRREERTHPDKCAYCLGRSPATDRGGEPGMSAPNFWHKPSGLKVWWYKYIGRGMEAIGPESPNLRAIFAECLADVAQGIVTREGGDAESGSGERSELEPGRPEGDAP